MTCDLTLLLRHRYRPDSTPHVIRDGNGIIYEVYRLRLRSRRGASRLVYDDGVDYGLRLFDTFTGPKQKAKS